MAEQNAQIIDFTTAKLERMWRNVAQHEGADSPNAQVLTELLAGYEEGAYDVMWENGQPFFAPISLDPEVVAHSCDINDWLDDLLGPHEEGLNDDSEGGL
jgi:hypothetical protein